MYVKERRWGKALQLVTLSPSFYRWEVGEPDKCYMSQKSQARQGRALGADSSYTSPTWVLSMEGIWVTKAPNPLLKVWDQDQTGPGFGTEPAWFSPCDFHAVLFISKLPLHLLKNLPLRKLWSWGCRIQYDLVPALTAEPSGRLCSERDDEYI